MPEAAEISEGKNVFSSRVAAAAVLSVAVLGGGAVALAASATSASPATFTACVSSGHVVEHLYSGPHSCASGQTRYTWNQTGPAGATGPQGPRGPQGPQGPAGKYEPVSVTAVFTLTGRDDSGNGTGTCVDPAVDGSSCWARDNITRTVTVTRHAEVPATDCGASATQCWFYTDTISDTGNFTTVTGAQTPNQECTEPNGTSCAGLVISGTVTGSLSGGGDQEFYADNPTPAAPATLSYSGDAPTDTSDWYKLFFPASTNFGLAPATSAGAPWTTWSWSYDAPATCETWTDAYNNGDGDGTYAADGNIAGINECTAG
jgi:hypothetical protein